MVAAAILKKWKKSAYLRNEITDCDDIGTIMHLGDAKKVWGFWKYKMAADQTPSFKKMADRDLKNCFIDFDEVGHLEPSDRSSPKIEKFNKSKMMAAAI